MIRESFENDFLTPGESWLIELWLENPNKDTRTTYSETSDKKGKSTITRTTENKFTGKPTSKSSKSIFNEDANLFKILAIEGGYNSRGKRENEYGLSIILASIINRLNYGYKGYSYDKTPESLEDVFSLRNEQEYNAFIDPRYKNFNNLLTSIQTTRGDDGTNFLNSVWNLTTKVTDPFSILINNGFKNPYSILSYQHNGPYNLFGKNSTYLDFDQQKTQLKSIQTNINMLPYWASPKYQD